MADAAFLLFAGGSLIFIVGVTAWIEIKNLDDRQFRSKRLEHASRAAEFFGALGMTVLFANLLIWESGTIGLIAIISMLGGFVAKSALDLVRVRQPVIDRT